MKQERMKILELLENQKISADEAASLLEVLKHDDHHHLISDDAAEQMEEKFKSFAKNVDGFAKDFGTKVHCAYKEVEPKLKKASCVALEKTATIVDNIAKSLHESLDSAKARGEDEARDDDNPNPN